jgi:hypothetical protein
MIIQMPDCPTCGNSVQLYSCKICGIRLNLKEEEIHNHDLKEIKK